ncbi:MAG: ComF family protein [Clostridiales bacterium]|jgi:ComF family protein|nr:ComF family protein [Clostridiales bacterium]
MGLNKKLRGLIDAALDWVYPPRCMVCTDILPVNGPKWICENCGGLLAPITPPVCVKCGAPTETDGSICSACRARKRVLSNTSIFVYDDAAREVIHRFKYNGCRGYAAGFAKLAADSLGMGFFDGLEALVPVPMFPRKRRRRGYNQAEELAWALSETTGITVLIDYLKRVRETRPQAGLTPVERTNNLKGAFALDKPLKLKSFLLIDDIYTTGETLEACANLLKQGGAEQVRSLTLAVAVRRETQLKPEGAEVYGADLNLKKAGEDHGHENIQFNENIRGSAPG